MPKRGRPRKNGLQDPPALLRALELIAYYDEAKRGGSKHDGAAGLAARRFKQLHPGTKASGTDVKRALSTFRPRYASDVVIQDVSVQEEPQLAAIKKNLRDAVATVSGLTGKEAPLVSSGRMVVVDLRIGPRQTPPRHNAKKIHDSARLIYLD